MRGDFTPGKTVRLRFNTHQATGTPITLAGTPAVSVYKGSTTESTAGVTLTVDYDSRTGLHDVVIDTSADGTFYAAGSDFDVVITAGTVDSISVVGTVVGGFSLSNRSALRPTTADRTLDVSAGGEAGVDWANVGGPTTSLALTGTTIATTQKVDIETIKTQAVTCAGGVTVPAATLASTTNITAGTIATVSGNVTGSVGSVTAAVTLSAGDSPVLQTGTAAAGGASTITLQTAAGADSLVNGCVVKITGGTGAKQARVITGYVDATKVATVDRAWTTNPDNTSVYSVLYAEAPKLDSSLQVTAASVQGSVTGSVASVSGNVGGNVVGSVASVTARVTANADQLAGQTVTAAAGVTFPSSVASPTNITAGTVTTATNVTTVNGLAAGVVTASSIAADAITAAKIADGAIDAATFAANAITSTVLAADCIGASQIAADAIGSSELAASAVTEIQSGLSTLTSADVSAAVWNAATASYGTAGSYGLLVETNLDALVSSRMATYTQPTGFLAATFPGTVASTTNITAATVTLADASLTTAKLGTFALAKTTNITGFNDIAATAVVSSGAITTSGGAVSTVTDVTNLHASAATAANQTTILNRLGAFTGSGVNTVLGFFKALLSKAASTPSDVGGTFDPATDSTEAIRDRGDSAWITATGFSTHSAADVWAVGARTLTAFSFTVDTNANATETAIKLKTDNLPSAPAAAGDAMTLTSAYDFAKGTAAMAESYNADGSAPTPAQALFVIMQRLTEFSISGSSIIVKKLDGTTTALTLTMDDATAPTSSTRSS